MPKTTSTTSTARSEAAKKAAATRAAKKAAAEAAAAAADETPATPAEEDDLLAGLREQAISLRQQGVTQHEIGQRLQVSASTLRELLDGMPKVSPRKKPGSSSTGGTRMIHPAVNVESSEVEITCTGACGQTKPARAFPTITGPGHRSSECRTCRDARRKAAVPA